MFWDYLTFSTHTGHAASRNSTTCQKWVGSPNDHRNKTCSLYPGAALVAWESWVTIFPLAVAMQLDSKHNHSRCGNKNLTTKQRYPSNRAKLSSYLDSQMKLLKENKKSWHWMNNIFIENILFYNFNLQVRWCGQKMS